MYHLRVGFKVSSSIYKGKESACSAGDIRDAGSILCCKDPLEEEMATHSNIAWKIHGQRILVGFIQSVKSHRVKHD